MRQPKAILFDLDDTISSYDSVCGPAWESSCKEFIRKNQANIYIEELLKSLDRSRDWYWADPVRSKEGRNNLRMARRDVVRIALKELGINEEESVIELADHYTELQNSMLALLPGAREALELVKQMGIRSAVITNGNSAGQREKLDRFQVREFFEEVFIDTEVGYSKPDKEIFQYALEKMALKPEEVWMVGDNLVWDVYGAQQLGIFAVWNDYRGKGLPENSKIIPDLTVPSIREMAELLRSTSHSPSSRCSLQSPHQAEDTSAKLSSEGEGQSFNGL